MDKAIDDLLESVDAPSTRPRFLPKSVLWDYKDCETDKSEGDIITGANKHRPKMNLTIRRPDGTKISSSEYPNIRRSADIIVQKLINITNSDPCSAVHAGDLKPQTKSFIRNTFKAEYYQAVLDLEAEQKLLRLCSAHWKADAMIGQALLWRSNAEARAATNRGHTTSLQSNPYNPEPVEPLTGLIPQGHKVASTNMAKRALELSPGPKSPSASHTQKRSKDDTLVSGQKTAGPRGPSSRECCT